MRFRIGSLSSVSVLPESGTVTVAVNGVSIRDVPLGAAYGLRLTEFDIPAGHAARRMEFRRDLRAPSPSGGLLRRSCGGAVDARRSGRDRLHLPGHGRSAFPISPTSPRSVRARMVRCRSASCSTANAGWPPRMCNGLAAPFRAIALAGRFAQPVVEFESSGEAGVDLVRRHDRGYRREGRSRDFDKITGPTIAMIPGVEHRRPTIVVSGHRTPNVDLAIAQLADGRSRRDAEGLKTLEGASGHHIGAYGQSLTFSDLGIETQELDRPNAAPGLSMPAFPTIPARGLRPASNSTSPADMPRVSGADAQISVEVNGHKEGSVRLGSARGESFRHKRHFLPLSAFRPGENRIEMRVNAPDCQGVDCDSAAGSLPRAGLAEPASKAVFRRRHGSAGFPIWQ